MRSFRTVMATSRVASSRLVGASAIAAIATLSACQDASAPTDPSVPTGANLSAVVAPTGGPICSKCQLSDDILAVRQTATGRQIFKVKPDGSGLVLLTNGHSPAWSPSRQKIAYPAT